MHRSVSWPVPGQPGRTGVTERERGRVALDQRHRAPSNPVGEPSGHSPIRGAFANRTAKDFDPSASSKKGASLASLVTFSGWAAAKHARMVPP